MRNILAIILFTSVNLYSQSIKYQLFIKDQCEDRIWKAKKYTLHQESKTFYVEDFQNPIISLPKAGNYLLKSEDLFYERIVNVTANRKSDTIFIDAIWELTQLPRSFTSDISPEEYRELDLEVRSKFFRCDSVPLNGTQIDYFESEKVRFYGNFENGYGRDSLVEYYPNGNIKYIRYFDNDGVVIEWKSYNENGNLIEE